MRSKSCLLVRVSGYGGAAAHLLALAAVACGAFSSAHADGARSSGSVSQHCEEPRITWAPTSLTLTQGTGTSAMTSVLFSGSCGFTKAVISVSRGLAAFVKVAPAAIASVPAQLPQSVQLTITIPANATVGSYQGRLSMRGSGDDDTFSNTLPIQLQVVAQVAVSGQGATVTPPTGYQSDATSPTLGGPVLLTNFGSAYVAGGLEPAGGAMITIAGLPLTPPPLLDLIYRDLRGANIVATAASVVAGVNCTQESYTIAFGPTNTSGIAVYCPLGSHLYKLTLRYRAGDPNEAQFLAAFQQVLNTVQLTP